MTPKNVGWLGNDTSLQHFNKRLWTLQSQDSLKFAKISRGPTITASS